MPCNYVQYEFLYKMILLNIFILLGMLQNAHYFFPNQIFRVLAVLNIPETSL